MKSHILTLLILQLALAFVLVIPLSSCESYYVNLYPTKGTIFTNIVLRAFVPPDSNNWIYWDDLVIAQNIPYDNETLGFALNFTCPNEPPYSDLGNHTVTVEFNYLDNGSQRGYMNATFEIIEYFPSSEYLALNATYYALLANYTELLNNYDSLLSNYSALTISYSGLLNNYTILLSDYNSLSANYNSLVANYNALFSNYNSQSANYRDLSTLYSLFLANYSSLLGNYNSLSSNYNALREDYDSLNVTYNGLQTNYSGFLNELAIARVLNYVFIAATIFLATVTVYLLSKRSKPFTKVR